MITKHELSEPCLEGFRPPCLKMGGKEATPTEAYTGGLWGLSPLPEKVEALVFSGG